MARPAVTSARAGLSMLDALSGFSDDQLTFLLSARPDLASPPPKDLPSLMVRASTWASVNACVSLLNRPLQQLLDALCLLTQPTTVPALIRLLAMDIHAAALAAPLDRLVDLALVFRSGPALQVHPQLEARPSPAGLGPPAAAVLNAQTATQLEAIARHLLVKPGRNKHETVALLVTALSDPNVLYRALKGSPTGTAELAGRLAEHPYGTVNSGTYFLRPTSPLGWLAEYGLVVPTDWETVVMPREVGLALRGGQPFPDFSVVPPVVAWRSVSTPSGGGAGLDAAQRVVADITTILDGWQATPPKMLKAGGLGVREIRRAATAVGRTETEAARLIELAAVAGLAGWDATLDLALPRPAFDEWLNMELAQKWAVVTTAWLTTDLHVNLAGAIGTNQKPIPPLLDRWPEEPAAIRRDLVLQALAEAGPGHAADLATLTARVTWDAPAVWGGGPGRPPTMVSWVLEEAETLGLCAGGALTGLGRLVAAKRLDDAMAELASHTPRISSQFVIQADLTAVATAPLPTAVRTELELLADLESSGAATVFRFQEPSLRRAYDAGRSAAQIMQFLEAHATKGVPQPLAYLVEDVARRHGRVRVGSASSYLRSDDPSLLAEILVARRSAKLGLRQLAPTVLTSAATAEVVVATLREGGYLPAEEDGAGDLVIHRRARQRAPVGHGPKPLTRSAAAQRPSTPPDFAALVRGLRAPPPRPGSDSRPVTPPIARTNGKGSTDQPAPAAPFSQLHLLEDNTSRPREIARTTVDILGLLDLCHVEEWMVRLEYTDSRGRSQLINGYVFGTSARQVTFGTMPGHGTRNVAMKMMCWARALTEAEEEAF